MGPVMTGNLYWDPKQQLWEVENYQKMFLALSNIPIPKDGVEVGEKWRHLLNRKNGRLGGNQKKLPIALISR